MVDGVSMSRAAKLQNMRPAPPRGRGAFLTLHVPFAAPTPRRTLRPGKASASCRILPTCADLQVLVAAQGGPCFVKHLDSADVCHSLPACACLQVLLAAQTASHQRLPRAASVPVARARAASPRTAAARGVFPQLSSHGRKLEKMSNLVRVQLC